MQRVFQKLPRYMRRRAASHNSKRVPLRQRQKAKEQMERDPPSKLIPTLKRKSRRKKADFNLRQLTKSWLESHVWHAKRYRMQNIWGFRIPVKKNEHGIRSGFRSNRDQSIMFDRSFMRCVELKGTLEAFKVLNQCLDSKVNIFGSKYTSGCFVGDTHLYHIHLFPKGLVCPFDFVWKQEELNDSDLRTLLIWIHPCIHH